METRSSGSVRIFWLDKPKILACLREGAAHLAERKPEVEAIWLFGSLARGDAVPGSDADVLVIVADSDQPFHARAPNYAVGSCGIGVDLFVYTSAEFDGLRESRPRFYRTLLSERQVLYARSPQA